MHQSGRGSPLPLLAYRLFEQSRDELILHYGSGFLCDRAAVGIDICRYFVVIMAHQLLRCLDIRPDPLEHRAICMPKHMQCERITNSEITIRYGQLKHSYSASYSDECSVRILLMYD